MQGEDLATKLLCQAQIHLFLLERVKKMERESLINWFTSRMAATAEAEPI